MVGSLLGVILFAFFPGRFPFEQQFATGSGMIATLGILSSYVDDIYSFASFRFLAYILIGYLESGRHTYVLAF